MVDQPVVGPMLYQLKCEPLFIRYIAAEHVYSDSGWLHGERLREKLADTRAGRALLIRSFCHGRLDPLATRVEFLYLARRSSVPMLIVYGSQNTATFSV